MLAGRCSRSTSNRARARCTAWAASGSPVWPKKCKILPVLWNRNDLQRFWFRIRKSFGSGSKFGSGLYLAVFSKKCKKILPFKVASSFVYQEFVILLMILWLFWLMHLSPETETIRNAFWFRFRWGKKLRFQRFRFHNQRIELLIYILNRRRNIPQSIYCTFILVYEKSWQERRQEKAVCSSY